MRTVERAADQLEHAYMEENDRTEEEIIRGAVLRLNGTVLGIVFGAVAALILFVSTNWLVWKGGDVVGPHLELLSQFFIGYSVTFAGSFIGAAYAFLVGFLSGLFVGWVYNAVVFLRSRKHTSQV